MLDAKTDMFMKAADVRKKRFS